MKKHILIFLIMFTLCLGGCTDGDKDKAGESEACEHEYSQVVISEPTALLDGEVGYICAKCEHKYKETVPATKSLKVLALGNSFSDDAMEHLYGICNDAGIEEIVLGNLYIGGCSLDRHWSNIQSDSKAYTFRTNDSGVWKSSTQSVSYALKFADWDFITVQQASGDSGDANSFKNLQNILEYLGANKDEKTKIYWHMTWAYQSDSTHSAFAKYHNSQNAMYGSIVATVQSQVLTKELIDGVIPSGTAIQNLRTSYLGDHLTRDGFHLRLDVGRYTAALTWFKTLTGADTASISWVPSNYIMIKTDLNAIKDSVESAYANPYAITQSKFKTR